MSGATLAFDIIAKDRASDKFDKVGRASSSAKDKLKAFAKVGAMAVGAAALAAGAALVSMAKAAMADEKAQAVLAKQLQNSTGATDAQVKSTEAWITKTGTMLGVTDDELRPALGKLVAVTHDVGKAQDLAALAMDVSAGTGKSLSTVSAALAKAQLGQVSGLSKLGVETKNVDGSTKSLNEITGQMAATFRGQAVTAANTTEGKFGRLKLMFDETKESIGSKLLPVLSDMASWFLQKGLPAIKNFGETLSEKFGPIITKLIGWFKDDLLPALKDVWEKALPGLKSAFDSVKKALKDMQPAFDLLGTILTKVLLPAFGLAAKTVLPLLGKGFEAVGTIIGTLGEVGRWLWNSVFQPVFKFIVGGVATVLDWFGRMLEKIGKVPGFGWVGRLGGDIREVAAGAQAVADNLNKIPTHKRVQITVDTHINANSISGHYAPMLAGLDGGYRQTGRTP